MVPTLDLMYQLMPVSVLRPANSQHHIGTGYYLIGLFYRLEKLRIEPVIHTCVDRLMDGWMDG